MGPCTAGSSPEPFLCNYLDSTKKKIADKKALCGSAGNQNNSVTDDASTTGLAATNRPTPRPLREMCENDKRKARD